MASSATATAPKRVPGPRKYDHLRPEEGLRRAWIEEGLIDREHAEIVRGQIAKFIEDRMPLLWRQFHRLVNAAYPDLASALSGRMRELYLERLTEQDAQYQRGYRDALTAATGVMLEETGRALRGKGGEIAAEHLEEGRS